MLDQRYFRRRRTSERSDRAADREDEAERGDPVEVRRRPRVVVGAGDAGEPVLTLTAPEGHTTW